MKRYLGVLLVALNAALVLVLACCANAAPGTAATANKAKAMAADNVSRPCLRVICFISLPLLD